MESSASLCSAAYTRKSRSSGRALPSCIRKNPGTRAGFCSVAYTQNPGIQAGFCPAAYTQNPGTRAGFCSAAYTQNPGIQAGFCPAAYTQNPGTWGGPCPAVYAKIQELEQASVLQRIQYRRKSGIPGRPLPRSVYSIGENPGAGQGSAQLCTQKSRNLSRPLPSSVYAKIQELEQATARQRIRKNPGTRAGFCSVAYTQKSRSPGRHLLCSVYTKSRSRARLCPAAYTQKSRNSSRLLFCSVYSIRKNPGAQAGSCPAAYTQNSGARGGPCPAAHTRKSRSPGRARQRIPVRISIHHKETGKSGSLTRFLMVRINADMKYYSVRTGSFLAALREGIMPEKSVSAILMRMRTTATEGGR